MQRVITYIIVFLMFLGTGLFLFRNYREIASVYVEASSAYFLWIGISVLIYLAFLFKRASFIENMVHEFIHLIFKLACLRRISGFHVTRSNGMMYPESNRSNMVITLSPYFFPLITAMMMLLFSFIPSAISQPLVIVSYSLFVVVTVKSMIKYPDEVRSTGLKGYLFLLVMTFWMSFLVFSWTVHPGVLCIEFLKSLCYGFIGTC